MMGPIRFGFSLATTLVLAGAHAFPAAAQQRPLPIEQLAGAGAGNVSLDVGADYARATRFTLSGLRGDLWRIGLVRIDVGLSSIADFEISGGLRDHLRITSTTPAIFSDKLRLTDPSSTSAFDDIIVGTKVRLVGEERGRPGVAVRVATRLPNAKHPSGLGQNTTDFYSTLIVGESVSATEITGNIGFGILGDPLRGNRRVDSVLYGIALSHAVTARVALVAGVDGRTGPLEPGLEPRAIGRAGAMWTHGQTRVAVDATWGLTNRDGNLGGALTAGFTFHGFTP
jgi:hypothetical protein